MILAEVMSGGVLPTTDACPTWIMEIELSGIITIATPERSMTSQTIPAAVSMRLSRNLNLPRRDGSAKL
jgi:hypothetical protein